ncbi:MAG: sodium ion-translocating decarboxylase subunit beta, partial [Chloroflexi bacterium]|nr:sodium ion-translocating decarboxylase subunit beta [Chloroflexota bacterium]
MSEELLGAFPDITLGNVAMIAISLGMVYLGVAKRYEPLLLLPIGLGVLLANLPATGIVEDDGILGILRKAGLDTELFPLLMFLGVGALTDFTPLIQNPVTVLLGAAAQFGIFAALIAALFLGWDIENAAAIGIIGSADGPTTIFVSTQLADVDLWGPIAVAAYSYMAMVPVIQPPIMRLLTTKKERSTRMPYPARSASYRARVLFPIIVIVLSSLIAPKAAPLVGMLMFGNLLREVGVVDRLSQASQNEIINVTTIFLGLTVGSTMTSERFL